MDINITLPKCSHWRFIVPCNIVSIVQMGGRGEVFLGRDILVDAKGGLFTAQCKRESGME